MSVISRSLAIHGFIFWLKASFFFFVLVIFVYMEHYQSYVDDLLDFYFLMNFWVSFLLAVNLLAYQFLLRVVLKLIYEGSKIPFNWG